MSAENRQLVRDALVAFGRGEYETFLSFFAEDIEISMGSPVLGIEKVVGINAWRQVLQEGFSGDPEHGYSGLIGPIRFEIDKLICEGDHVVEVSRGLGYTTKGRREYRNRYCRIWEIRNGKVVSFTEFLDTALFQQIVLQPRDDGG